MSSAPTDVTSDKPSWEIISKLFNLSQQEFVYDDFGCSMLNKILLPGHLYCMENHLCFYTNMMGAETKVIIAMQDIEEINKKSSLGFLKSGIEIICKNKKTYHFTGFSDREAVYELIQNIWKGSNGGEEIVARVSTNPTTEEAKASPQPEKQEAQPAETANKEKKENDKEGEASKEEEPKGYVALPLKKDGDYVETVKLVLFMSINKFYELFVDDNATFSSLHRLQLQGAYNIVITPWKLNDATGLQERAFDFEIKVDIPFGPSSTRVHSDQTCKRTQDSIELIRNSRSLDVPYANAFHLIEKWTINLMEGSPTRCMFVMSGAVVFDKSVTFSGMIKSTSIKEFTKDNVLWYDTVRDRKLIGEALPASVLNKNSSGGVKKELKHEIEKAEGLSLNRDNSEGGNKLRKDLQKRGKMEDQLVSMKKAMNLLGVLLLTTIFLFLITVLVMNRKLSAVQSRLDYLEAMEKYQPIPMPKPEPVPVPEPEPEPIHEVLKKDPEL